VAIIWSAFGRGPDGAIRGVASASTESGTPTATDPEPARDFPAFETCSSGRIVAGSDRIFSGKAASVGKTKQNGVTSPDSVRVQLGTLLLGYSYRLNPKQTLNVSLGAGLTRDTPDVTLSVRIPTSL